MRSLIVTQNLTADGAVEMLDDWFDPLAHDEDMLEINRRDRAICTALVLGRQTFEDFRGFWPEQVADPTGVSNELNELDKYVVSTSMTDPRWTNSTVISAEPIAAVRDLLNSGDGEVVITGSISLCHTLIAADLVDGYRLWTYPHIQGRGRRLFPDGYRARLQLIEHLGFSSGVTYTHWMKEKA